MKRITATTASRSLAHILDRVERRGQEYRIERRGKDVAAILPVRRSIGRGSTVGDLLDAVRAAPRADDRFAPDLQGIRRA